MVISQISILLLAGLFVGLVIALALTLSWKVCSLASALLTRSL